MATSRSRPRKDHVDAPLLDGEPRRWRTLLEGHSRRGNQHPGEALELQHHGVGTWQQGLALIGHGDAHDALGSVDPQGVASNALRA